MSIRIKPIEIGYHPGVGSCGFHIVRFKRPTRCEEMIAVVFAEQGNIAVLQVDELADGNIGDGNKWRGDEFETSVRQAIKLQR